MNVEIHAGCMKYLKCALISNDAQSIRLKQTLYDFRDPSDALELPNDAIRFSESTAKIRSRSFMHMSCRLRETPDVLLTRGGGTFLDSLSELMDKFKASSSGRDIENIG